MQSTLKYIFFFLIVITMIATLTEACKDEYEEHCKVFAPFCKDARYKDIASKCAVTCGKC